MESAATREHQVFWMLAKGEREHPVGRVYLAIQAALAFGADSIDAGVLMGEMMAKGRATMEPVSEPIGAEGLAFFDWLFEVELVAVGDEDTHEYRFRRRRDGRETQVRLRTARGPRSLQYQQAHQRKLRALTARREAILGARNLSADVRTSTRNSIDRG